MVDQTHSISAQPNLPAQSEIVRQLTADGEQALARFFSAVRERLQKIVGFRLDYRLNGRVSDSDVLQETYIRAAQRIGHYLENPEIPFFVWLRLEVNQKLAELHRHHFVAEKRDVRREINLAKPFSPGETSMALAAHLVANVTSASRLIERSEQIAALEKTLCQMNELDREVIALRHFEELSNIETAQVLGIESAAASKRYLRALERLREIMHPLINDQCNP